MEKKFVPYTDLSLYQQVLIVDSYHPDHLALSHWKGAPKIPSIHDETSTGIVLNALEQGLPELKEYPYVSNNHFDIDGFLSVWSLLNQRKALQHQSLLRKMALLAEYRELTLNSEEDHLALKLVCWINQVEKERFYAPFASWEGGKNEMRLCISKYGFFLRKFEQLLAQPDEFRHDWEEAYQHVIQDLMLLEQPQSQLSYKEEIRLMVAQTPQPLNYYALFSRSRSCDMVLSIYSQNRYELEYKLSTWVDCARRPSYPRLSLQPLANLLNRFEETDFLWRAEKITDTAPILRLGGESLTKERRYDHPANRTIHSSSIPPEQIVTLICDYFEKAYRNVEPKSGWSWQEIHEINARMQNYR